MCDHNHQAALFLVISNEGNTSKSGVVSVIEPPSVIVDEAVHFVVTYTVGPLHPVTILFVSSQLHPPLHCRPESDPVDRK